MKLLFGGVRGSAPCAEPGMEKYGGHTACLLATGQDGELVLLDAGSGLRTVTGSLNATAAAAASPELTIVLTHLHLDHLIGLPMLPMLYDPRWTVTIMGVKPTTGSLRGCLDRLLSPPLWPFALDDFPATVTVREFAAADQLPAVGGLAIRGTAVPHPNGCTAWRLDEAATGAALVLATDLAWSLADPETRGRFEDLCRQPHPVDLLVMDGHFAPDELAQKEGWGHSSTTECVAAAQMVGAGRLLITHHAPDHDDRRLDAMAEQVHSLWDEADLARQGMEIFLPETMRKEP